MSRPNRERRAPKRFRADDNSSSDDDKTDDELPPAPAGSVHSMASTASLTIEPTPPPAQAQSQPSRDLSDREKFDLRFEVSLKSNEEVLELQMKTWLSPVYKHFRMPPNIQAKDGTVKYVFVCLLHPSETVTRARHDASTSNLNQYVERCAPADSSEARQMVAFAQGSTYNPAKHRMKIAIWVARRHRPFAIVEDPELLDIFHNLNNKVETPKRRTVSSDIKEIFKISQSQVSKILQAYPGRIHLCVDGWTSPQVFSYLGGTVHWVVAGQMTDIILDFIRASKAHTGEYLAPRVAELLMTYGLQEKIMAIVCDNASNNDTMIAELARLVPAFGGHQYRIRCFAHVLNLVVKAVLSQFAKTACAAALSDTENAEDARALAALEVVDREEADMYGEVEESDDEVEVTQPQASPDGNGQKKNRDPIIPNDEIDNPVKNLLDPSVQESDDTTVNQIIEDASYDERTPILSRQDVNIGRFAIFKLRTLAHKISNSPTIRADLQDICRSCKIPAKQIVKDVSTRWNSTALMIESAIPLQQALTMLVVKKDYNKAKGVRLQRYQLSTEEWELLKHLHPVLDVFIMITKRVCKSGTPLIHEVIPLIDIIITALDEFIDDSSLPPAIRAAAVCRSLMLNKYYSKTDDSVIFRVAMILHPKYKTTYMVKAKWEDDWIEEAKRVAREEWKRYKPAQDATRPSATSSKKTSAVSRFFEDLDGEDTSSKGDALEEWMNTPPIDLAKGTDVISWWSAMLQAGHALARMAIDFLSVPATSTDVERAFSRGGLTVSKMRHSLSDESTCAATVLGSWAAKSSLDIIPHEELITHFKNKKKRSGKGQKSSSAVIEIADDDMDTT